MTTPATTELEDARWLIGVEGGQWLDELRESTGAAHQLAARLRKALPPSRTRLLLEQLELRSRASQKFSAAESMLFTRLGYEQSTDEWVAGHKAERFAGLACVGDLCCGIGGDTAALATVAPRVVACDRSELALTLARHNVPQVAGKEVAGRVVWQGGDAMECDLEEWDAWHIDPDRRPAGRRTTHVELHEPSDEQIDQLRSRNPHAAIKLAPGTTPGEEWSDQGELEWISREGQCRQLVVWLGRLARNPGQRRATIVRGAKGGATWSAAGEPLLSPYVPQIGAFVYEPDAAILAANLAGWLAEQLGLWSFASTIGYLSGTERIDHPAVQGFRVEEVMPYKPKQLAAYLRERKVGRLEIKQRLVNVAPEKLRKELKLSGEGEATLMVTRVEEKRIALVCQRLSPSDIPPGGRDETSV